MKKNTKGSVTARSTSTRLRARFLALAPVLALMSSCGVANVTDEDENLGAAVQSLEVPAPTLYRGAGDSGVPGVGYFCNMTWPNNTWSLYIGGAGDFNTNQCSSASGAKAVRVGSYLVNGTNFAEAWCDSNYYWSASGTGSAPLSQVNTWAATTQTSGNCTFRVTMGRSSVRTDNPGTCSSGTWCEPPPPTRHPKPAAAAYTFDYVAFKTYMINQLMGADPNYMHAPVGFQFAVRDPSGNLVTVLNHPNPYKQGSTQLPNIDMTTSRRLDMASMSKTITAMALAAAIQDFRDGPPTHNQTWGTGISLDSKITPYIPTGWTIHNSVNDVTFRSLLQHTSGFCGIDSNNNLVSAGDSYSSLKAMVQTGATGKLQDGITPSKGTIVYCNAAYALLRILIPYLVDSPYGYNWLIASPQNATDAQMADYMAAAYRNYVRGRVLSRIGLTGADDYWTGTDPLSNTYWWVPGPGYVVGYNCINAYGAGGYCGNRTVWGVDVGSLDEHSDFRLRTAGSGGWFMSDEEFSKLISKFWNNEIVSSSMVTDMLGNDNTYFLSASNNPQSLGFDSKPITFDGNTVYYHTKNGGGAALSVWVTFFNKYTAVFSTNTNWGLGATSMENLVVSAFMQSVQ